MHSYREENSLIRQSLNEKYRSSLLTLSLQDMYGGGFGTKFGNGSYFKGNRSYLKVRGSYLEGNESSVQEMDRTLRQMNRT